MQIIPRKGWNKSGWWGGVSTDRQNIRSEIGNLIDFGTNPTQCRSMPRPLLSNNFSLESRTRLIRGLTKLTMGRRMWRILRMPSHLLPSLRRHPLKHEYSETFIEEKLLRSSEFQVGPLSPFPRTSFGSEKLHGLILEKNVGSCSK